MCNACGCLGRCPHCPASPPELGASAPLLPPSYRQVISDLLKPEAQNLVVREDKRRGVHVEGLSEWVVRSPAEVYALMERGAAARATGATKLNEISSRS